MSDIPRFTVVPPMRCWHALEDSGVRVCARLASWYRPGPTMIPAGFFCHEHRAHGDKPIPGELVFRRVSACVEVMFAGAHMMPGFAEAEAAEQLRQGVNSVGGLLSLQALTSMVGRYTPEPAPKQGKPGRPRSVSQVEK